jgi:predicted MPP superfamily phosphohydrolase
MTEPIPSIVRGARCAPVPVGPLTGRRTALRRAGSHALAALNRLLDRLPVGRTLHRRIQHALAVSELPFACARGGAGLDGLRIAFLTDLHAGSFMDASDLCRVMERVAAAEPHLVLFGGDLINTREREILLYRDALRLLRPELGVFAVPGNHDHFWGSDIGLWTAFLREHGVQVLLNRGVRIERNGASLWLCGVDDLTEGAPDLRAALDGRRPDEPALLLSHHPDFFFEAAAAGVDLTLSGHTHGGQIRIGSWAPIHHSRFGYERGWFAEGDSRLYVSRGIGVTVLPLRIGAPPEIPVFAFASARPAGAVDGQEAARASASADALPAR